MARSKKPAPAEHGLEQLLAEAGELIIGGRLVKAQPATGHPVPAADAPAEPAEETEPAERGES